MKTLPKRVLTGLVMAIIAAITVPILTAAPASALGVAQSPGSGIRTAGGGAALQSGDSATDWTLRLPANASCPGDSPNDGWRWQTYMVPSSVDPATLTFGSAGPTPSGVGASFRQPLYDTTSNPVVNQQTPAAVPSPGPGPIESIPDVDLSQFTPGQIPAGVYNVGIACTLGGESATQMNRFWNVQMTISTAAVGAGGPAQITWQNGTIPAAPVAGVVTAGDAQLTVAFTQPAGSNPAITGYTATANPGGLTGTAAAGATSVTVSGLTNLTSYTITIHSTNAVGNSVESNSVTGTPGKAAVTGLTAVPSPNTVTLDWNDVAGSPTFTIDYCTAPGANSQCDTGEAGFATTTSTTSDKVVTPVTPGTVYTFTVYYPQSFKASASAAPLSNSILIQDLTVSRPNGALVLTQVCGRFGDLPSEPASNGFPTGFTADTATTGGTAPTLTAGGTPDPNFGEYPYPDVDSPASPAGETGVEGESNAVYPTHCSLNLGTAKLVTKNGSGLSGAGQFFSASGRLNQVTVVDTREEDDVWTVNLTMSDFTAGAGKTFSGNQLGWTNTSTDTAAFQDGLGVSYDQSVTNDSPVPPNTVGGAGTSHAVSHCTADNSCLGIATIDARLKLLIPVYARNGNYTGQLTITAA